MQDIDQAEFENNIEKQYAVIRRIEIIGEAVKGISVTTREKYPNIPWRAIAGMRDIVSHNYFGVSVKLFGRSQTEISLIY